MLVLKGWMDYCYNQTLCEEHLSLVLPCKPPFHPLQFETCVVVGKPGDLLKDEFGQEIDANDAVIRDDEAPLNERYAKYIGMKRKFSFLARGVARKMIKVANGSGVVFQRGAKGNGMKSIELALSMCDTVGIYGFTVDPSYKELPRYFSRPCKGHNPLQICRDKPIISLRSLESIHRIRERKKIDTRF